MRSAFPCAGAIALALPQARNAAVSTALTDEVSRPTSYLQPHVLIGDKPGMR